MTIKRLLTLFTCVIIQILIACNMSRAQQALDIAVLGDSNTWLGGDDCTKQKGWTYWFCQIMQPSSCRSYARSGATWTNTERTVYNTTEDIGGLGDDNVIYNQVMRLKEAYDSGKQPQPNLIIIAAGTNDVWFLDKRPAALSQPADAAFRSKAVKEDTPASQILTLASSVKYSCDILRRYFPEARLLLLSPLQTTAADVRLIHQAGDIIEGCAVKLGAEIIRQDKVMKVNSSTERKKHKYTYDGTHTNELGAKSNGELIAKFLTEDKNKK